MRLMAGVTDPGLGDAAKTSIEMMKVVLNVNGSDDESIVSSKGGSDSGEEERDLLKALAQRATDPYIKARKAKGPFVYVKPRLRPGRHMYIDEEIQKAQDVFLEEQLRQKLKGAQYRITGLVKFDKHGLAKGFEVQEVATAISSAVKAVLHEERAAMGGSLERHAGLQEQLDADFASKVAERAAWSDPVFEDAVRAARSQALTASSAIPPSPKSPSAQASIGPSTGQACPPPSSPHPLHLQQPPGWDGFQQPPSGTPSPSIHLQQSPPPSAPSWSGPHHGAQILNLEQARPLTSSPAASLSVSPSFAPLPPTPAQHHQQQQQQQQQQEGWEGYSQSAGQTTNPASLFLQKTGEMKQHTHVPLIPAQQQDVSSPFLRQQGWTQGEGYGTRSIERDSRERNVDCSYPGPDTREAPEERGYNLNRGHRGYIRGEKGAYHDDGKAHRRDRHARHRHERPVRRRSSSGSREHDRHHRRHRHYQGSREKYQADGMRGDSMEGEGRRVRAEEEGRCRYGPGNEPRGHRRSSRREVRRYKEEGYLQEGGSRREESRAREDGHRSGGKEEHRRNRSRPDRDDQYREHQHSSRPKGAAKDGVSRHRRPESRPRGDDNRARSRDVNYSSRKDAYRRPDTSTQLPHTAATSTSKVRAMKHPESEMDSQASDDSKFPGLGAVLQSEEATALLRPAVSSGSEAEPDPNAQPRNPAEVKARLHGNPRARLMREARKERWTSSDDDGGFSEYVRQSKAIR